MTKEAPFEGKRLALFDLDGTLRRVRPTSLDALSSYASDVGLPVEKEARHEAIRWSHKFWSRHEKTRKDLDRVQHEALIEDYLKEYLAVLCAGRADNDEVIAAIIVRFQEEFDPQPYLQPGAKEILWNLREAGLVVGLVSNRGEPLTGLAIELDIIEHFNFTLSAGQVNSWKPDAGIFRHALRLGGEAAPEEAVYVGDNYYTDVVGASGVGIDAILVDEEDAFPEAKKECLVISQLSELRDSVPEATGQH